MGSNSLPVTRHDDNITGSSARTATQARGAAHKEGTDSCGGEVTRFDRSWDNFGHGWGRARLNLGRVRSC